MSEQEKRARSRASAGRAVTSTSIPTYVARRSLTMYTPLAEQMARVLVRERQLRAEADRAARLVTVRRRQRIVVR